MFNTKCLCTLKLIDEGVFVCVCLCLCIVLYRHNHTSSWSSDGCRVTFAGSGVTSCLCNHTTNFAVLMNYLESKVTHEMICDVVI